MNKEKILALADYIETHQTPEMGFNMGSFWDPDEVNYKGDSCDTVACIAGWAVLQETGEELIDSSYVDAAEEILGLDGITAAALCIPIGGGIAGTADQAITVLRHLAETGDVIWKEVVGAEA